MSGNIASENLSTPYQPASSRSPPSLSFPLLLRLPRAPLTPPPPPQTDGKSYIVDYVPWKASISGCCRYNDQSNDPGLKFTVDALVNTRKALASPDPRNLPEVSLVSMHANHTRFTVPAPLPTMSPAAAIPGIVKYAWCSSSVWTAPSWSGGLINVDLDPNTGIVTWPRAVDTTGMYHLCVNITANPYDPDQGVSAMTDFRVRVHNS